MAKGYWNVGGAITNPAGMGPFLTAFGPFLEKHGGKLFSRHLETDVREGKPGHLTVIIEWPSYEAATKAYESDDYQQLIALRQPHSEISLTIIEEGDHASH